MPLCLYPREEELSGLRTSRKNPTLTMLLAQFLSRVQLFVALWTVVRQAPLSMEFSRQKYWRGVPLPSPIFRLSDLKTSLPAPLVGFSKASQETPGGYMTCMPLTANTAQAILDQLDF